MFVFHIIFRNIRNLINNNARVSVYDEENGFHNGSHNVNYTGEDLVYSISSSIEDSKIDPNDVNNHEFIDHIEDHNLDQNLDHNLDQNLDQNLDERFNRTMNEHFSSSSLSLDVNDLWFCWFIIWFFFIFFLTFFIFLLIKRLVRTLSESKK